MDGSSLWGLRRIFEFFSAAFSCRPMRLWLQRGRLWLQGGRLWLQRGRLWLQRGRLWLQRGRLWLQRGRLWLQRGRLQCRQNTRTFHWWPLWSLEPPQNARRLKRGRLWLRQGRLWPRRGRLWLQRGRLWLRQGRLWPRRGRLWPRRGRLQCRQNTRTFHWWSLWSLEPPQNARRLKRGRLWLQRGRLWLQRGRLQCRQNTRTFHWWPLWSLEAPQNARRLGPWSQSCRCLRLTSGRCPQLGRPSLHLGRWSDWMRQDNQFVNQSLSINENHQSIQPDVFQCETTCGHLLVSAVDVLPQVAHGDEGLLQSSTRRDPLVPVKMQQRLQQGHEGHAVCHLSHPQLWIDLDWKTGFRSDDPAPDWRISNWYRSSLYL